MRALTLWQPWASLVTVGAKRWETRRWGTAYRGPILIHAAARIPPRSAYQPDEPAEIPSAVVEAMIEALGVADFEELPRGAILAAGFMDDCRIVESEYHAGMLVSCAHESRSAMEREALFGDWTPGRFVWHMGHVRRLGAPVPARGARGLWTPSGALRQALELAGIP